MPLTDQDVSGVLCGWEGYRIGTITRTEADKDQPVPAVWIELIREPGQPMICSGCHQTCSTVHDWDERWVRDLPILDAQTHLCVQRFRVRCRACGPKLEQLSWLEKYARITTRFALSVARLCRVLPIKHVAEHYDLDWDTVKAIDKAYLERTLGEPDLSGLTRLAMDEFAIQRGYHYATIFVEPERKEVVWVCRGRGREDIRPFFERLGPEGRQRLEAVAIDMSPVYEAEVRFQCPQAQIVFDQFHVVSKYAKEVIDPVRTAEGRKQTSRRERLLIQDSRWMLLRNAEGLKRKDRVKLKELLRVNRHLATVYILKDDLKHLWDYRSPEAATRFWKDWYQRAVRSRIRALKRFARLLNGKIDGIIAHCRYPLHTSLLEGINNKIKVIKRMAYGFRDDVYFFLKIRQAFPGNTG